MNNLENLISAAIELASGDEILFARKLWKPDGGRPCPIGWHDCSQVVFMDIKTGEYDYGYPNGIGYNDCLSRCPHDMIPYNKNENYE